MPQQGDKRQPESAVSQAAYLRVELPVEIKQTPDPNPPTVGNISPLVWSRCQCPGECRCVDLDLGNARLYPHGGERVRREIGGGK